MAKEKILGDYARMIRKSVLSARGKMDIFLPSAPSMLLASTGFLFASEAHHNVKDKAEEPEIAKNKGGGGNFPVGQERPESSRKGAGSVAKRGFCGYI